MKRALGSTAVLIALGIGTAGLRAQDSERPATPALVTAPMPFIGITPCRVADTRDPSFPPDYGPPSLSPGVPNGRTFVLVGRCGIAASAVAVSLNVTAVNPQGVGFLVLFPQDGAFPPVSTLNYAPGQTVPNAAIVPLGTGGAIRVVAGVSGTDLIIDVNGYFAATAADPTNTFLGLGAGSPATAATTNTGIGYTALSSTASGGTHNTAVGFRALLNDTTGFGNVAAGSEALFANTSGADNTAIGSQALFANGDGASNVAIGSGALSSNVSSSQNTAIGVFALHNSTGSTNTALGYEAGINLTSGDRNLYVGNQGAASESGTIRIGDTHTRFFMVGVRGVTTGVPDAINVFIDSTGQVGTQLSSIRYKEDVREMGDSTNGLLELRPVTFHYKADPDGATQFGLIAEEVERVLPDLVARDSAGAPEGVMYHELPAMLLNELQKQQEVIARHNEEALEQERRIQRYEQEASTQQLMLEELRSRLSRLEKQR